MRNNVFEIEPYRGAGPLQFGMTQDEVAAVSGTPALIRKTRGGDTEMRYPDYAVRFGADQTLAEIGFSPSAKVVVRGIDVFDDPDAFDKLVRLDGEPLESVGIIVLMKLGTALTGLHVADPDQKSISAFRRGRWDEAKNVLTKFQT